MKFLVLAVAAGILTFAGTPSAEAGSGYRHGGGGHRGHYHGHRHVYSRVYFAPYYAYPRYYYPAPVYYAPAPAPVYVEQPAPPVASAPQGDWYYCASARAYYPDVPTCAEAWQRIAPRP